MPGLTDAPAPCLVLMGETRGIERDARTYFAHHDDNARVTTLAALVIGSPVSRVIGNFFIGLSKPKFPTRLFNDVEEAETWLKGPSDGD